MNFFEKIAELQGKVRALQTDVSAQTACKLPSGCYFLNADEIVCYPRSFGDSRYPYSFDGLNLWAHSSGNIRVEESTFNVFLDSANGREPNLCFYVGQKQGENYFPVSVTGAGKWAFEKGVSRYTVFTPKAVYYFAETKVITACLRAFVDDKKNLRFSLAIVNESGENVDCYLSAYFEPMLSTATVENIETKWFRSSRAVGDGFLIRNTRAVKRGVYVRDYAKISRENTGADVYSTTSRTVYKGGMNNQITCSTALINGAFSEEKHYTEFTDTAVAGDIFPLVLRAGERFAVSYTVTLGTNENVGVTDVSTLEIDGVLSALERDDGLPKFVFDGGDGRVSDVAFNYFVKNVFRQVDFCAKAKNYAGAYIGIRDIFQQLEGALSWIPEYCRKKIVEALGYVGDDGRAPRQYSYPDAVGALPAMDLREFIDQGVWIISTVYSYLAYTSDYSILDEMCGYYHFVGDTVAFSERKDTVLQHLTAIVDFLLDNLDTDTGCLRALYGDWNDALDGLGKTNETDKLYGSGVSVMATLQLYQNLGEIAEILQKTKKYPEKRTFYEEQRAKMQQNLLQYAVVEKDGERKILHGWGDKRRYLVGSFCDNDGQNRDGATSNAFWVTAGMLDSDRTIKTDVLRAYERLDSKYGIKTFEPFFAEDNKGVGRIIYLPKGTAENGATYIHATLFAVWSLFEMGESEKAWQQIYKILPLTHEYVSTTPFVMPNSYVENAELGFNGESMSDWFTGSGCVLVKVLLRYVFGLQVGLDGVTVAPSAFCPFEKMQITIRIKGVNVTLSYEKKGGSREFFVDGVRKDDVWRETLGVHALSLTENEFSRANMRIDIID